MLDVFAKGINFTLGKVLQKRKIFVSSSLAYLKRSRSIDSNYFDYVRLATLELVSHEIKAKNLKGNVAELGVYKGKFARYINQYFPDRLFYLFDTFEGFDSRDVDAETAKNFSSGEQDFSDTSVEGKAVKGFFPESARDVNDSFVFVSLDADLFEPLYNGLIFFYPKLVAGGYIFIHDFNNDAYPGARKAVEQFCSEQNISFLPIPDLGGSAIITK
jgi:O-methyltransferase